MFFQLYCCLLFRLAISITLNPFISAGILLFEATTVSLYQPSAPSKPTLVNTVPEKYARRFGKPCMTVADTVYLTYGYEDEMSTHLVAYNTRTRKYAKWVTGEVIGDILVFFMPAFLVSIFLISVSFTLIVI